MSLVYKDENDEFIIGPLTEAQYLVISDSLALASLWTDRVIDAEVAHALRTLIPEPDEVDIPHTLNRPIDILEQLPGPGEA